MSNRAPASDIRVLHVDTERGWRGGQRQVLWLASGLSRRGYHSVLAARPSEPLAERARAAGVAVVPCAPFGEADPLAALSLRRVVRRQRVTIVHAHTAHAMALGALATLGTAARMVVTRRVSHQPRANAGTRWKYGRASAVIAVASASARALVASGIATGPISVVPSGVDLGRRIDPPTPETLIALGLPPGAPLVVMVAALTAEKDPITFVRAVAEARRAVPALCALLVGDGPLRPEVERAAVETGVSGALRLSGFRDDAESLLAGADVVVLSSRMEGTSGVILDALSLGKPVVATAAGGNVEIIADRSSGFLVPVGDARAMGARIAEVFGDTALARKLSRGARRRAEDYSIDRTVDRTLDVYRRVLAAG